MYRSIRMSGRRLSRPDAAVCLIHEDDRKLAPADRELDAASGGALSAAVARSECRGEVGDVVVAYGPDGRRYVALGLGKVAGCSATEVRAAASRLVKPLSRMKVRRLDVSPAGVRRASLDEATFGLAFGSGLQLAAFSFESFKKTTASKDKPLELSISTGSDAVTEAMTRGLAYADAQNYARRLAATPPNVATTTGIASEARKLAQRSSGLTCRVIQGKALQSHRLTGLTHVGRASVHPPCLIELTWKPRGRARGCVLLIGKTISYDTGGLSLKINNSMKGMKYDKCGGMAVLGAMQAVARIRPKCRVVALLPTAENAVSENAYRPDDILTFANDVTVEVTNTDAEGRLVLADALVYGCRRIKPDAIIDLATLTGGVVVALGGACAGLWCEDDALRSRIEAAAESSGERVWRMPLHDDYREMMKSTHADIWNSAPVREAHPIQGAAFLSYFVEEGVPWAHLDIAGVASVDKERPPFTVQGPTGYGVRLLAHLFEQWE